MAKKDELKKEDLEFAKDLFGNTENNKKMFLDREKIKSSIQKDQKKEIKSTFTVQVADRINEISQKTSSESNSGEFNLKPNQNFQELKSNNINKKKIKKKELLSQIYESIPLIQVNNLLLKELISCVKTLEVSLKALTQEPIIIKILK